MYIYTYTCPRKPGKSNHLDATFPQDAFGPWFFKHQKTNNMVVFFTAAVQKLRKLHSTGLCQGLQRFGKSKFKTLTFIHHFVGQYPPKKHNNFQKNKMDDRENQGTYRFPRTTFKPQLTAKLHDRHHPILTAVWSQMVLVGKVHRLPEGVWMSNCLEH